MQFSPSLTRSFAAAVAAGALLLGCAKWSNVEIGDVEIQPRARVTPGEKVELSANVRHLPAGAVCRFVVTKGFCSPTEFPGGVFTTFQAPGSTGKVTITIQAVLGAKILATKVCSVEIMPESVLTQEASVPLPVASAIRPSYYVSSEFIPSGFMGDAQGDTKHAFVQFDPVNREFPYSPPTCQKWAYTNAIIGWAAVAWQFPENNWGETPGKDFSRQGFSKVVFAARGAKGGEVIEFFAGGHTTTGKPHQASFAVAETFTLAREWREYSMDLDGNNLSSVLCAFGWTIRNYDGPLAFFLDDVRYEP